MEPTVTITWTNPTGFPLPPQSGEIHLWLISLDQAASIREATALLSDDERERSQRMRMAVERHRFILARAALRIILSAYLDTPAGEIDFLYGEKGKPVIAKPKHPVEFNLSHSGDLALLAISTERPVGIDLEPLSQRRALRPVALRVFPKEINDRLQPLEGDQYMHAFFHCWTELEARVKALGEGVFSTSDQLASIRHINFQPAEGWVAAVAMEGGPPPVEQWSTFRFSFDLMTQN